MYFEGLMTYTPTIEVARQLGGDLILETVTPVVWVIISVTSPGTPKKYIKTTYGWLRGSRIF